MLNFTAMYFRHQQYLDRKNSIEIDKKSTYETKLVLDIIDLKNDNHKKKTLKP